MMVQTAQQLDWQSVNLVLLWKAPRTIKKPADIYLKLWGLIQTINTTLTDLQQHYHDCNDPRQKPILAQTISDRQRLYPDDDFPLIAFHPTNQSYHSLKLKTDTPFFLTLVFGGEYSHRAKAWFEWFKQRLTLENTGFSLLEPSTWHDHHATLPAIASLTFPKEYHNAHSDFNPLLEQTILVDMPANFSPPTANHPNPENPTSQIRSTAHEMSQNFIQAIQKRLKQWFPTQASLIERWINQATPYLLPSPLCLYQLHEQHHIQSQSKSSKGRQFHHGLVGWLTVKDAWTQLDGLWKILFSIHLLGQRTQINGLGYILSEDSVYHSPPTLMEQYFTNPRSIHNAVNEVLFSYDLEPELDSQGKIMEENALTERLHTQLLHGTYQPQPTIAVLIEKPHGGTRRIEQLSQQDMIVHRLLFYTFAPIIDKYQSPLSLGYRKGYSRDMARQKIQQLLDDGYSWVIEADIEDFFNSIPLDKLWQQLAQILPEREKDSIALLKSLMQVGYILGNHIHEQPRTHGLMQGSPLSPILANLYLSQLDEHISEQARQAKGQTSSQSLAFVRYADDFLIFCRNNSDAKTTLESVSQYLNELGLNLALAKTAITPVQQGFEFLGYRFDSEGSVDKSIVPVLKQRKPLLIAGSRKFIGINGSAVEIRQKGMAKKVKQTPLGDTTPEKQKLSKTQLTQVATHPALQNQLVQIVPLRRISQLIILGNHALSSPLLSVCAKEKISVHFVNQWGFQVGTLTPVNADYFAISAKQYHRHQSLKPSERLAIACDIVCAKIGNYQTWIKNSYRKGDAMTVKRLDTLIENATQATDISQLMGYEGVASKVCFERLQSCFIPEQKDTFSSKRRSRGGKDRLNSLLNFGYYWLFTRISSLIRSHGLNPYLSFLHDSEQSYETLVYDVMELFRVQVDKTVLRLINRKQLQAEDFYLHEKKGWQLTNQAIHLYSNQLQATFSSQLNQTYLEDIILMQIRTLQNWAMEGQSLIWFYWYSDKDNPDFSAPDDNHDSMTYEDLADSDTAIERLGEIDDE